MFIRALQNPMLRAEGDGSGGDMEAMIKAAVESATAGLAAKNAELLNEVKAERNKRNTLEQQISSLGDTSDLSKMREVMERMQQDADLKLIAEGGKPAFEEVLTRRTKTVIAEERGKVEQAQRAAQEAEAKANDAMNRWRSERMNSAVANAVAKAKALPDAAEYINMKASQLFELDDEVGAPRLRENVKGTDQSIDRNGNPLTLDTWVESLRDSQPFFFGIAAGGGGGGGTNQNNGRAPVAIPKNDPRAVSSNLEAIAKGTAVLSD
jgi:hypothetical protein